MIFGQISPKEKAEEWNQFIVQNNGSFLQSEQWGEFQKTFGRKTWRVEVGGDLKALIIKHNLPLLRNYLYCPRGPVLRNGAGDRSRIIKLFIKEIKKIAKKERSIFLKVEPEIRTVPLLEGLSLSSKQIQPSQTLILDITKSEDDLLKQMGQKTRYNIKLSQRKGIAIREAPSNSRLAINAFLILLKKTAEKDNFHAHPEEYYQKMFNFLGEKGLIKLFLAKRGKKIIAAGIFSFFGETAVYLHGASDYNSRQLMAPYLLQWQAILEAKKLGLKYYDFGGIDAQKWPGVTRFKRGFGGREITHPGAFDLVFRPIWYKTYNIVRRIL